ncbi:MAG: ankyrin repeat domain-containing protein [Bacilli bacterium]|nr:ankyrin repeat domain-containing protein [Bacilli bacterium]MDD7314357.1 ankyrin repeat domain-containing protein [Bacilli bacterium]MDY4052851.1 ankyrin repeat domain-containing protein [Bacilli bacterium]
MKTNRRKIINDLAKEIKTPNQNLAKLKTMIKQISKLPIDMNTRIYKGRTLLHYAVIGNNSGVINLLSKAGVNPNICDDNYNTPLHFAILKNSYYAVHELLKIKGIDVDSPSEFEQTPLHKAVILGNLDIIKLLIKYGADPELVDEKNQSPLDYAQDEGDQEIIKYLVATLKRQKGE